MENLINKVIDQIRKDLHIEDTESLHELLSYLPGKYLESYLPEEDSINPSKGMSDLHNAFTVLADKYDYIGVWNDDPHRSDIAFVVKAKLVPGMVHPAIRFMDEIRMLQSGDKISRIEVDPNDECVMEVWFTAGKTTYRKGYFLDCITVI